MFGDLRDEESFLGRGGRIVCEEGIAEFVEELLVFAFEDYVEPGGEAMADGVGGWLVCRFRSSGADRRRCGDWLRSGVIVECGWVWAYSLFPIS
jgi:hypothetical protein